MRTVREKILITIGARGGSKGVKNKNIRPLMGKPLISYTIKQALAWGKAHNVVVSTDSQAIADVAVKYGASVPFMRPKKLATDASAKVPAIRHAVASAERIFDITYDIIVDLDATAPLRTVDDLDNCLKLFMRARPTTLFSVVESHKNPYFNMIEKNPKTGRIQLSKKLKTKIVRRQDAPKVYDMNASIYFYDRDYLMCNSKSGPLNPKSVMYEMAAHTGYDIDREIDFKFLEFLVKEKVATL